MLDEFRSTSITWDKATRRIYSPITANASDENGRKLVVQIVNSGQVEDLTGATLHLYWETRDKAHDGLDVFKAVDLKKGEFELSYTTGMLSNQGVLNANLVLIDTVGRVVSERFKITVTEGIDNDAIQSENSFTTLTQALIDISNLEQNYAPRLNDLTAQLQQTEQSLTKRVDNLVIPISPENANIEVTDAHNSIVKNKTFSSLKDRLEESEGDFAQHRLYYDEQQNALFTTGKNLFNPNDTNVMVGYGLRSGGRIEPIDGSVTSGYIPVSKGDNIVTSKNNSLQWEFVTQYDVYKSYVSYSSGNVMPITDDNVKYVRVSIAADLSVDKIQIEEGTARTDYEDFYYKLTEIVSLPDIEGTLKPNTQNHDIFKDNIFAVSENKLNINDNDYIIGGALKPDGNILIYGDTAAQRVTGFIPIKENQKLWVYNGDHLGVSMYCAFYDSNKDFITYLKDTDYSLNLIEAPLNSSYVRVQSNKTVFEELKCMIEISEQPTFYKPYGLKVNVSELTGEWDNKKPLSKVLRNEIERVENKVVDIRSDFVYGWATDTHIQVETQLYKAQQMAELNKTGIMNVMFDGGDILNGSTTKENVVKRLQRIARVYKDTPSDMVMIRGNHDIYWKYAGVSTVDDYTIDNHIWHNLTCRHQENKAVFDSNNPHGGYYYKDYPTQKIRVVVLNTSDVLDDTGHWLGADVGIPIDAKKIRQQQFSWLCNTALNFNGNGEGWAVITVAHAGLMTNSDLGSQGDNFSGVLNAFVTGGTFSLTTDVGTPFELVSNVDFTTQGAMEYIAHNCGDSHWDRVSYDLPIGKTPRIHTCNMGNLQKTSYPETGTIFDVTIPTRGTGGYDGDDTVECEVADVFNINRTTKTIIAIRYGAGVDRIIPYDKDVRISVSSTQALVSVLEGTLIWESKNPTIATVSNGVVTGVLAGQVVITATDINGQIEAWRAIVS